MTIILSTAIVLAVVGLLIGLLLVSANETFKVEVDPREAAIRECLPGNNCGGCGLAGCDALAAAIVKGKAPVSGCPVGGASVARQVSAIMGVEAEDSARKVAFVKCAGTCEDSPRKCNYIGIQTCEAAAIIPGKSIKSCQYGCLGIGSCVAACQFDAIHIVNGIAEVDRSRCVGCGKCVATCPQRLIEIVPDPEVYAVRCSNHDKGPTVRKECAVGCFGCGVCVKQCEHEAITVSSNLAHIDADKCVGCGKCAEKCPAKIIRVR